MNTEIESLRQQLAIFESAVEHVTEYGKTKRSFSVSEGWAMVHKERLIDLECAEEQLAASQAREVQLRAYLHKLACLGNGAHYGTSDGNRIAQVAIALPADTTALSAMITKAGEVMRERAMCAYSPDYLANDWMDAIRALPGVTLEDLK